MTILFAMALFAFSMSITPGPVNFILLSTGVNHGFKKVIPFATGVILGFMFQMNLIAMVMERLVGSYDIYLQIISYVGAVFIVYMGDRIATSNCDIGSQIKKQAAPGFKLGTLLSWINPKAG
jgi:threonine/homoserine/homoserine lactone efflux protein